MSEGAGGWEWRNRSLMCNLLTHLPSLMTWEGPKHNPFSKVLNTSTMDTRILKVFYSDSSGIRRWNWDCDLSRNNAIPALLRPEGGVNQSYTRCDFHNNPQVEMVTLNFHQAVSSSSSPAASGRWGR